MSTDARLNSVLRLLSLESCLHDGCYYSHYWKQIHYCDYCYDCVKHSSTKGCYLCHLFSFRCFHSWSWFLLYLSESMRIQNLKTKAKDFLFHQKEPSHFFLFISLMMKTNLNTIINFVGILFLDFMEE